MKMKGGDTSARRLPQSGGRKAAIGAARDPAGGGREGVPISRRETSRSRIGPRMPTAPRQPSPYERAGSAEVNAMVARVTPDILWLLGDGVPRRKPAVVAALAGRHAEGDVELALIRLAVTERVVEIGG